MEGMTDKTGPLGRSATDTVKDVRDSVKFGRLWG